MKTLFERLKIEIKEKKRTRRYVNLDKLITSKYWKENLVDELNKDWWRCSL